MYRFIPGFIREFLQDFICDSSMNSSEVLPGIPPGSRPGITQEISSGTSPKIITTTSWNSYNAFFRKFSRDSFHKFPNVYSKKFSRDPGIPAAISKESPGGISEEFLKEHIKGFLGESQEKFLEKSLVELLEEPLKENLNEIPVILRAILTGMEYLRYSQRNSLRSPKVISGRTAESIAISGGIREEILGGIPG